LSSDLVFFFKHFHILTIFYRFNFYKCTFSGQCTHGRMGSGDTNGADDSLADDPRHWTSRKASARRSCENNGGVPLREWRSNPQRNGEARQLHQFRNLTVLSYREEAACETRNEGLTHFEGVTVNVEYVGGAEGAEGRGGGSSSSCELDFTILSCRVLIV
jgi:hypothetical protein